MSPFDIIVMIKYGGGPAFMAKDQTVNLPIVGFLLKILRCIIVYRDPQLKATHANAADVLTERIKNPIPGFSFPNEYLLFTTPSILCR